MSASGIRVNELTLCVDHAVVRGSCGSSFLRSDRRSDVKRGTCIHQVFWRYVVAVAAGIRAKPVRLGHSTRRMERSVEHAQEGGSTQAVARSGRARVGRVVLEL